MDTVDFEITFSLISAVSSENLENNINTLFQDYSVEPSCIILPGPINLAHILHNLS